MGGVRLVNANVIVGEVSTTVNVNVLVAVWPRPSSTVNVIVAAPVCTAAGVTVTVRSAPLPPNTMLASGTNAGLDEAAVTVNASTDVSASPTVNGRADVGVFSFVA